MSALEIVLALVMLAGLAGTVVPYFPGVLLILAAVLAWAIFEDVGGAGWAVVAVLTLIGLTGMLLGVLVPVRAAAGRQAPRWVYLVGLLGVVVGFFVIPVVGALVGGPLAILAAEFYRLRDSDAAVQSTWRAVKGIGLGILVEFLAGFLMIVIWAAAVLLI